MNQNQQLFFRMLRVGVACVCPLVYVASPYLQPAMQLQPGFVRVLTVLFPLIYVVSVLLVPLFARRQPTPGQALMLRLMVYATGSVYASVFHLMGAPPPLSLALVLVSSALCLFR